MSDSTTFSSISYSEASPQQRHLAQHSARHVLEAAYPHLSRAQWELALDHVQPLLLRQANRVVLAHEGLAALVYHLASTNPAAPEESTQELPVLASPVTASTSQRRNLGLPAAKDKKQTYAIPLGLLDQLANVSYWRRIRINHIVLDALAQWLRQYPEAQRPRPTAPPPDPA